jgi:uncharacterized membrane protein YgcG
VAVLFALLAFVLLFTTLDDASINGRKLSFPLPRFSRYGEATIIQGLEIIITPIRFERDHTFKPVWKILVAIPESIRELLVREGILDPLVAPMNNPLGDPVQDPAAALVDNLVNAPVEDPVDAPVDNPAAAPADIPVQPEAKRRPIFELIYEIVTLPFRFARDLIFIPFWEVLVAIYELFRRLLVKQEGVQVPPPSPTGSSTSSGSSGSSGSGGSGGNGGNGGSRKRSTGSKKRDLDKPPFPHVESEPNSPTTEGSGNEDLTSGNPFAHDEAEANRRNKGPKQVPEESAGSAESDLRKTPLPHDDPEDDPEDDLNDSKFDERITKARETTAAVKSTLGQMIAFNSGHASFEHGNAEPGSPKTQARKVFANARRTLYLEKLASIAAEEQAVKEVAESNGPEPVAQPLKTTPGRKLARPPSLSDISEHTERSNSSASEDLAHPTGSPPSPQSSPGDNVVSHWSSDTDSSTDSTRRESLSVERPSAPTTFYDDSDDYKEEEDIQAETTFSSFVPKNKNNKSETSESQASPSPPQSPKKDVTSLQTLKYTQVPKNVEGTNTRSRSI